MNVDKTNILKSQYTLNDKVVSIGVYELYDALVSNRLDPIRNVTNIYSALRNLRDHYNVGCKDCHYCKCVPYANCRSKLICMYDVPNYKKLDGLNGEVVYDPTDITTASYDNVEAVLGCGDIVLDLMLEDVKSTYNGFQLF